MDKNPFPTPSKRALKKLGYLKDQKGIVNRFLLEVGWKSHTENTKRFIVKALANKNFRTVSVLGSGWFLDLPIDFLLEHFEKIYCFDINHPKQITHKYRKENKIEFIEADVTNGIIGQLHKTKKIKENDIPFLQPNKISDVVISLNLLSQIDNLLFEYSKLNQANENLVRKTIQERHLEFLSLHPYLLITDYEEVYRDGNGAVTGRKSTVLIDLPQNKKTEKWTWEFDTNKTYNDNCTTELNVVAIAYL